MSYKVPIHPRRGWIRAGLSRVRRIDKHGKLLTFHSHEQHRYIQGKSEPHYSVPALITEFEYWPAEQSAYGKAWVYGHDYYKPGRWREFLAIEDLS